MGFKGVLIFFKYKRQIRNNNSKLCVKFHIIRTKSCTINFFGKVSWGPKGVQKNRKYKRQIRNDYPNLFVKFQIKRKMSCTFNFVAKVSWGLKKFKNLNGRYLTTIQNCVYNFRLK